jgi:hypothetical protein
MSPTIQFQQPDRLSPSARRRRRLRWLAVALGVYSLVGFWVLPAIIRWQLREQLPVFTHRQAAVQSVRVNPFALSLTIRGLWLTETNGAPFAGFDEFHGNFQLSSLFRWTWTFSEIKLAGPAANVVRFADGSFNFSDLLTNAPAGGRSTNNASPPPVLIQRLIVTNALLTFTDHTTPTAFHTVYGPTHLELENLSTRPNEHGPYALAVRTDEGEAFNWSGTLSLRPPQSQGSFTLSNIPPAKYGPYLAQLTTARVARGTLDVGAHYGVSAASVPPQFEVSNAFVRLHGFELHPPAGDEPLLTLNDFLVQNVSANLTGATVRVPLVQVAGGTAFVRRDASGRLEAEQYVTPATNAFLMIRQLAADLHHQIQASLTARLDALRVTNFAITVEDRSLPSPAQLGLDHVSLVVTNVSNQTNAPLGVMLGFDWRGGGHVGVAATGTILPPVAEAQLTVSNLALPPLQPYVEQQANLVLQSGDLSVDGTAQFDPVHTNTPLLRFAGNVSLSNFLCSDTIAYHEFARWEHLAVRGIDFALDPNHVAIDEIKFTALRSSLVISSNGQVNVLALRKLPATAAESTNAPAVPAAPAPAAVAAEPFPLKLGALVFERGSFGAADQSLASQFSTRIEEFDGSVRDLTFPGLARATVDLRGKVSALAPFAVTGTLTPDLTNPFVDLKITFTNTDLTPLTPYAEKFAGYAINKGKLAFDVHYKIENRALQGENLVAVDQFTFGARNNSPDATKLPVRLGVALLKDRNGRIDLDLPVSGSLDDPSFRIGGIVWKALLNVLIKATTSPFALLGALAGGGEELQFVDFTPGLATLNDSQTNKLMKLTKALYERPALNLEIGATCDAQRDAEALGRAKVLAKMKTLRIQELVARGKPAPEFAVLQLEDDDYERLLRRTYREAFNTTPEQALREALLAAAATNASVESAAGAATTADATETGKGATALTQRASLTDLVKRSQSPTPGATGGGGSKPKTESQLVRDELERRLMTTMPVGEEDLRTLMQRRIEAVQQFLSATGTVAPDRLFPVTPNAADATKAEARVVFSLN